METTVYRLTFETQLHLGRATGAAQTGSLGLEKSETYIAADTLFSAICQTWAIFYDTQSLTEFLKPYTEQSQMLPFMLTSAFPYAENLYLFPKPLTFRGNENTPDKSKKKIKKVRFISKSIFQDILAGNSHDFDKDNLINSDNICISADEKEQLKKMLLTAEELKQLEKAEGDKLKKLIEEKLYISKTATRPRVTIDRQTNDSSIWHVQTVQFNKNCGLWLAAKYNSDATRQKVETLLRVLGDNGIGGERNAGYGQFKFDSAELDIPTAEDSHQAVTLSPICPNTPNQLGHLINGDTAYNINTLSGWLGSHNTAKKRKQINMFAEGSVLNTTDEPVGRLVDLTPDDYPHHPVYRYGYAWQVGIKGTKNETEIQT